MEELIKDYIESISSLRYRLPWLPLQMDKLFIPLTVHVFVVGRYYYVNRLKCTGYHSYPSKWMCILLIG